MKKILLIPCILLLAVSCSGKKEEQAQSSGEIMHNYTQTLSTAPGKAKGAADVEEKRNAEMENTLKELDK